MDNNYDLVIKKLFPEPLASPEDLEIKYPPRKLAPEAMVTRVAPSPTGFVHFGGLYASLISERFAHQSGGIFILRIEDTDKKREVAGTAELFAKSLNQYGIFNDEGLNKDNKEIGDYGPYKQSERAQIYHSYVKDLLLKGRAYPCFASTEELEELRNRQEVMGERSGYYGHFAVWRNKSVDEVLEALDKGLKPVIRLKSPGNFNNKVIVNDLLVGRREMPENDQDIVIMKADGLPTYHFAHAVDDHLMRTSHVVRGNEWFPSLPLHLQLFATLGWEAPVYAHLAPIQKMEGVNKRKLSKRKDEEANLAYYKKAGYPEEAVIEYLLNLANSNFEDWRRENAEIHNSEFKLSLKKLAKSNGPLFDLIKLTDISKDIIARLSAEEVYISSLKWAQEFDTSLAKRLQTDESYAKKIFNIEREGAVKPRKDISRWSEISAEISYFYDDNFILDASLKKELMNEISPETAKLLIQDFLSVYNTQDNQEEWFNKLKDTAAKHGYAASNKEYQADTSKYKGQVGTVAKLLRFLLTGRLQTPNLCAIMQAMGEERIMKRLNNL
ncbi:MAG: glutamate--tRNA ligase [Patescibacteria group bacterium]|nr:glutamate--tRNA ligase [Patescibacteria group bacterium]